jgi:hypothetical protein
MPLDAKFVEKGEMQGWSETSPLAVASRKSKEGTSLGDKNF